MSSSSFCWAGILLCGLTSAFAFRKFVSRRALLQSEGSRVTAAAITASSAASGKVPSRPPEFSHSLASVSVAGVTIPVAIWRPASTGTVSEPVNPATYPYKIDIGKIAAKFRVGWLSWLPKFDYKLPCGATEPAALPGFPRACDGDCVLFAHGFLGSVYDFAHAAEALASDGFTVIAPEFPESLSASYIPPEGLTRDEIIAAARELVNSASGRWGIFGHSAGAASALLQRGEYKLGRACFAGGVGRFGRETGGADPVFICSSNGDGCNRFMRGDGDIDLRPMVAEIRGPDGRPTILFKNLGEAYAAPGRPPARGAFIFAADNTEAPLPCHISFLWSEVDDAMVSLLSPLLPLAKALGLFLLDFDVYRENKDAERTAALLVPALRRFFLSSSSG